VHGRGQLLDGQVDSGVHPELILQQLGRDAEGGAEVDVGVWGERVGGVQ